jgi:hypothetical protein
MYQQRRPVLRVCNGKFVLSNGGLLVSTYVMFLDCPAYMDSEGAARCGLPAAVEDRYTMTSTDGPLESAKIRCPRGHSFNGPVEAFLWRKTDTAGTGREQRQSRTTRRLPASVVAVRCMRP